MPSHSPRTVQQLEIAAAALQVPQTSGWRRLRLAVAAGQLLR